MTDAGSLRDSTAKKIQEQIRSGAISREDILTESAICEAYGISRTPAREALISLCASGVLEREPRKGYRVLESSTKDKLDAFAVWGVLDSLAAKMAIPNLTDEDILRMKEAVELAAVAIKYRNLDDYTRTHKRFHDIYRYKCGNPLLLRLLEQLETVLTRFTYYFKDDQEQFALYSRANDEHQRMIACFEAGDGSGVENIIIHEHWTVTTDELSMI